MGRDIVGLWDGLDCRPTSAEKAEVVEVDILHLFHIRFQFMAICGFFDRWRRATIRKEWGRVRPFEGPGGREVEDGVGVGEGEDAL